MCHLAQFLRPEDIRIAAYENGYLKVLTSDANGIFWEYRKVKKEVEE